MLCAAFFGFFLILTKYFIPTSFWKLTNSWFARNFKFCWQIKYPYHFYGILISYSLKNLSKYFFKTNSCVRVKKKRHLLIFCSFSLLEEDALKLGVWVVETRSLSLSHWHTHTHTHISSLSLSLTRSLTRTQHFESVCMCGWKTRINCLLWFQAKIVITYHIDEPANRFWNLKTFFEQTKIEFRNEDEILMIFYKSMKQDWI